MTHFIESIGPSLVTANAVLDGFSIILQFDTLLYIGLGMLVGMLVGAFPGVTATMAVALAAGFTMTMEPMQGLSVLLTTYVATTFGDLVPAFTVHKTGTQGYMST